MPLYAFQCGKHYWDDMRLVSERDDPAYCPACQKVGERVLTTPVIHGFEPYADENLSDSETPYIVRSRADRERRRKELGLADFGPSQRARDMKLEKQRGRKVFAPRG